MVLTGPLDRRISAYVARLPRLSAGQGRHRVGYRLACWLVRDLNLADQIALGWLERWDAGNAPPLGPDVLASLLECAHDYGQHGYGSGLGEPVRGGRRRHEVTTFGFSLGVGEGDE